MSSAFNTVDVSVIKPKLRMMGFGDKTLELINSYMVGRRNTTRVDNHVTGPRHVSTGIGEGSVLGPLVFLVTVLNVDVVLERTRARVMTMFPTLERAALSMWLVSFADDISGLISTECPNVLRAAMTILSEEFRLFFSAQGLKVNGEKEEHITWGKSASERAEVTLSGRDSAEVVKLLGVSLNNSYSFMPHAVAVTRKMMARVSYLYRIREHVSKKILRMVTSALICSVYCYCIEIYANATSVQKYLQRSLNIVLRVATWGQRDTRIASMLAELKFLNVPNQYRLNSILSIERLLRTEASSLEFGMIKLRSGHSYETRNVSLKLHWRPFSKKGENSHLFSSVKIWNDMGITKHRFLNKFDLKDGAIDLLTRTYGNGNC